MKEKVKYAHNTTILAIPHKTIRHTKSYSPETPALKAFEDFQVMYRTNYVTLQESMPQAPHPSEIKNYSLGCYGKPIDPNTAISSLSRIEIYRPLQQDPKTRRRANQKPKARTKS